MWLVEIWSELIRGVITGIPVDDLTEELIANIRNVKVKEAKRLKMKRDGVLHDSLSVLLMFDEFGLHWLHELRCLDLYPSSIEVL